MSEANAAASIQEIIKPDICVGWDTNMDDWWTHHPDWEASTENETHYCFSYMTNPDKANFFRQLYDIQYNSDCSNVITQDMGSTGWGADFKFVNDGLLYAYNHHVPLQVYPHKGRWHYAAKKDASAPVCPRMDMSCYFLNISSCRANPNKVQYAKSDENAAIGTEHGRWVYQYATRAQTWLRREIFVLKQKTKLVTPCTVAHVRRSDVIIKGALRRYHAIQEYVDAASMGGRSAENIFLVTDDQNAIDEAISQYPHYNWMYLDRPRYRGAEGGWEQQIPSDDPKFEVIVILSIFQLAQQCDTFVYSRSRFASQIGSNMPDAFQINLDDGHDIFNDSYASSVNISQRVHQKMMDSNNAAKESDKESSSSTENHTNSSMVEQEVEVDAESEEQASKSSQDEAEKRSN